MAVHARRGADRQPARFREGAGGSALSSAITFDTAVQRLTRELDLLGALYPSLSTDVRHNRDGSRDRTGKGSTTPPDPGAVTRFRLDGRDYELACDRWDHVAGNIAAIAAHVDALRAQERWGVADLRQAFAGHVSLPAPGQAVALPWRAVLGFTTTDCPNRADVDGAYRLLARDLHPDMGGTREGWDSLVAAYEQAKLEIRA